MPQCNPSMCKTCRNQYTCQTYINYMKNAQQPIQVASEINPQMQQAFASQDLTPIVQSVYEIKSTVENSDNTKFALLESRYKKMQEINEKLVGTISSMSEQMIGLTDKVSKLDGFISMVETNMGEKVDAPSTESEGGLTVYDASTEKTPIKTLVEKTTKGLFGIGKKTTWVEEEVKQ